MENNINIDKEEQEAEFIISKVRVQNKPKQKPYYYVGIPSEYHSLFQIGTAVMIIPIHSQIPIPDKETITKPEPDNNPKPRRVVKLD